MSKILVTTDASELGQKAVAHAQALAQALNAELVVLSVVPELTPAVVSEYAYVPPITPEELAAEEAQLRAQLERTLPAETLRIRQADGLGVSRVIVQTVREEGASLVVMSTHGRSGLGRALLGSVAEDVARHSPVPVMLVRDGMPVADWAHRTK